MVKKNNNSSLPRWLKVSRNTAIIYLTACIFFIWGFATRGYGIFPFQQIYPLVKEVEYFIKRKDENKLHYQETQNRFSYSGFHIRDSDFVDPGYLLISQFSRSDNQVIVRLIRISDFKTLHTWIPPVENILSQTINGNEYNEKKSYRAMHPLLFPDGGLIFSSGKGSLVKIDKHNNISWTLNGYFHHSIEPMNDGNILVCYNTDSPMADAWRKVRNKTQTENTIDYITKEVMLNSGFAIITKDGHLAKTYTISSILLDNNYEGLLLGSGSVIFDHIHLNDAEPVLETKGMAKEGDIILSSRNLSAVFLYRPSTNKIIWLKTGPWLKQHDVNLLSDGTYSIFGNDVVDYVISFRFRQNLARGISNIYIYDPATNTVKTPFTSILKQLQMQTGTSGRSTILENGDAFIEETESNRLLRVSTDKVRWEYVNGVSDTTTGALNWCRYLTAEEIPHFLK